MKMCFECVCAEFDVLVTHCVKKGVCEFSGGAYVTKYYRFENTLFVVKKVKREIDIYELVSFDIIC